MKKGGMVNGELIFVKDNASQLKDLDWALGLNRLSLRVMGVWPEKTNEKLLSSKIFPIIIRTPSMIITIFCFLLLPQAYAFKKIGKDLLLNLDNFVSSLPAFNSCVKLFFFWRTPMDLKPVVNSVTEDWLRPKMEWEYEIMRKEAYIAKLLTVASYAVGSCAYGIYAFGPMFGLNFRLLSNITDYGNKYFLVQSYYPYYYAKSPIYELTHLSQVLGGTLLLMALAIPDTFFGVLVFHLSAQFKILGLSIENLFQVKDNTGLSLNRCKLFNEKLAVYIDRHVHLMKMVSSIEKSFNFVIMMQICSLGVVVCVLGLRVIYIIKSDGEKLPLLQTLNLCSIVFSIVLFTLADCAASETLAEHSGTLLLHIYSSKWYAVGLAKRDNQKLIIMMMMSKKPQLLTAGKILHLSIATYCSILKTIAGYISVLLTVSG